MPLSSSYRDEFDEAIAFAEREQLAEPGALSMRELPGISSGDEFDEAIASLSGEPGSQEGLAPRRQPRPEAERGFLGDVASHTARGLVSLAEHGAQGLKTITGGAAGGDTAEYLRELPKTIPFLRPDVSESEGESIIKRGGMGAIESAPMTGAVFAGAAGGAKLGALATAPFPAAVPAGAVIGGFLGAGATMLGLFGAGTYGKRKDEATKELSETRPELSNEQILEMSHTNAMSHAKAEILGEGVGDFAAYLIFSRVPGGKIAYRGGKAVLKDLVAPNAIKIIAKGVAKDMPFEVGSEVWTAYTQHKADEKIGIEKGTALENMGEAIIPAMFLSGGMGVGLGGYNAYQRKSVYNAINSKNPEERVTAINLVSRQIAGATGEKKVAQKWREVAMRYVEDSQDVPVDAGFSEFIAEEERHKKGSEAILDRLRKGSTEDLVSLRQSPEGAEYAKELDQVIGEKGIAEERGLIPRKEAGPKALPPGQGFDLLPPKPEVRLRPGPEKIKGPTYPEGAEYVAGKKAPEELEVEHKPVLTIKEKPFKKKENAFRALESKRLTSKGITRATHKVIKVKGGFGIVPIADKRAYVPAEGKKEKVKGETLIAFVRAMGGIRDASLPGEVRALSGKETGVVGLTTSRTDKGLAFDEMASAAVEHGWLPENLEDQSEAFSKLLRDDIFAQKEGKQRAERQEDIAERTEREERWDEFERSEDEELEYFAKHPDEVIGSNLDQWQRESVEEIRRQNDARAAREIEESSESEGKVEAKKETPGLVRSEKDEGWTEFSESWDENDALDKDTLAELDEWRAMQEGEGIAVMAKEATKEAKLKAASEKVKAETPGMLKESDKVNDVTLGTLVKHATEDPAKALEHATDATVSKAKLIEGLKNKGLKAMGEAKSKEERAEIKKNLEETLRGIEEGETVSKPKIAEPITALLSSKKKAGINYEVQVKIEETGETVTVTKDAAVALRETKEELSKWEKFLACLS